MLGRDGRGSVSHFGLEGRVAIQVGTLSKAVGVLGGYVAGSQALRDILVQRARPFLFSTSHPPAVAAACREAIRIMVEEPELIERLWANTRRFKAELTRLGFDIGRSETPITPVMLGDSETTIRFSNRLFDGGRVRDVGRVPDGGARPGAHPDDRHRRPHGRPARPGAGGVRPGRPRAGRDRRVSGHHPARRAGRRRHAARGPTSSTTSSGPALAAGLGDSRDLPLDSHLHTVRSPDANAMLDAYCVLAVERGIAELAITDHVDFDPTMPAYGFASFADRERDVREAAERWADRGLAIRFGVEVTYERALRGRHPRLAARAIRTTTSSAASTSARSRRTRRRNVASFVAGRSLPDIVAPYFDEVIGAARSGLFDTIGHLDFVKRYLVPHVMPAQLAAAPELYEPVLAALVETGTALEVNASGLRQLPRETYPSAAIVARYRELGGRHVTIGTDAHRTEWFAYGLGKAYRQRLRRRVRGAHVPARGRSGRRPRAGIGRST